MPTSIGHGQPARARSRVFGTGAAVCIIGFSAGVASLVSTMLGASALLLVLALAFVGEWMCVRLGPYGEITLRPVVAFVALWTMGVPAFIFVGLLPVVAMRLAQRDLDVWEVVSAAAREALLLWLGWGAQQTFEAELSRGISLPVADDTLSRLLAILVFWLSHIATLAIVVHSREGIKYRLLFRGLVREALSHIAVLSVAALGLGYVMSEFGPLAMALAATVLVEGYYPWKLVGEQSGILLTSLQMMAQAVDLKDPYTSNHSQRVARLAVRIARELGLAEPEVEHIRIGALLHDLGKIGVSNDIIRKPGKLTAEEYRLMMKHSGVGADIIEPLEVLGKSASMVRHHHEHWDGSGYPDGLKGPAIPLGARIILVADAFDALTTDRPYRMGTSRREAMEVIQRNAGLQFDPVVVEALKRIVEQH